MVENKTWEQCFAYLSSLPRYKDKSDEYISGRTNIYVTIVRRKAIAEGVEYPEWIDKRFEKKPEKVEA